MTKQEFSYLIVGLLAIGVFLGVALSCVFYTGLANAEDELVYNCWILCRPGAGSEVMIRERPNKQSRAVGAADCGKHLWTDWQERNGWLHVVDLANETGEGWVSERYVVFAEPEIEEYTMVVTGCRNVACRRGIGGRILSRAKRGTTVTVYAMADGWAVTNRGFIQNEYLKRGDELER